MSASIEVLADLIGGKVDLLVAELDGDENPLIGEDGEPVGPAVELSVSPDLARELAFRLTLAAIKIEDAEPK